MTSREVSSSHVFGGFVPACLVIYLLSAICQERVALWKLSRVRTSRSAPLHANSPPDPRFSRQGDCMHANDPVSLFSCTQATAAYQTNTAIHIRSLTSGSVQLTLPRSSRSSGLDNTCTCSPTGASQDKCPASRPVSLPRAVPTRHATIRAEIPRVSCP
jgi:hypothetical protein